MKCEKINEIAKKYDLPVIEDAAQGIGASYEEQPLGTLETSVVLALLKI